MNTTDLKLDWCSYEAARYAVENWHYSQRMPRCGLVKIGVWEYGKFIGCVLFGKGACPQIASPFGISRLEAVELVRVALREHVTEVTKIIAIALKMLTRLCPKLRIVVSYADPEQGHHGGIYQAGNWVFLGVTKPVEWFINTQTGSRIHTKGLRTGRRGYATSLKKSGHIKSVFLVKLKYAMPLDSNMKNQLQPLRKPYPKRAGSADSGTSDNQSEGGGAIPTSALSQRMADLGCECRVET